MPTAVMTHGLVIQASSGSDQYNLFLDVCLHTLSEDNKETLNLTLPLEHQVHPN